MLITGSRNWGLNPDRSVNSEEVRIAQAIVRLFHLQHPEGCRLINGVAKGADLMVRTNAKRSGWILEDHWPRDYQRTGMTYGQACYARNAGMVHSLYSYHCAGEPIWAVALWKDQSKGTGHTIDLCRSRDIEPTIITATSAVP